MKKLVYLLLMLFIAPFSWALNFNEEAALHEHMFEVNKQWQKSPIFHQKTISFQSEADRIQMHLLLVIQQLKKKKNLQLTEEQASKRLDALNKLLIYANAKVFPENILHASRIPYFIDYANNACAVGEMLRKTDHEHVGQWVRKNMNNAYISEIPTGELDKWAEEHGFTRDELAWIQPAYAPSIQGWVSVAQGVNGPARTMVEYNGKLIFAGEFTEASGLSVNNVVAWNGMNFETLGDGVNGWVNCSIIYQGKLYLGGSFNGGFADIAIWDGDTWSYEAAFASKFSETNSFGIYLDKLYAGGFASGFAGVDAVLAIWENPNWTWVAEFEGESIQDVGSVNSIVQYGDEMIIGGDFHFVHVNGNMIEAENIALFTNQGTWIEFNGGLNGFVNDIEVQNNDILVGGAIASGNGSTQYFGLARNEDETWESIPSENTFSQNNFGSDTIGYFSKIFLAEGDTILAGNFSANNIGLIGSSLAHLETSFDYTFGIPSFVTTGEVFDIINYQDKIYIAGAFDMLTDSEFNNIALFDSTIDIQEIATSEYQLFPNPVDERFQLQSNLSFQQFYLYDSNGKRVPIQAKKNDGNYSFDISHCPRGQYIFYALSEKGYLAEKILKH